MLPALNELISRSLQFEDLTGSLRLTRMVKTTLVATLHDVPHPAALDHLPGAVEWLEVRADQVRRLSVDWLRNQFGGRLLYSLRSRAQGGNAEYSTTERRKFLLAAARNYDLID